MKMPSVNDLPGGIAVRRISYVEAHQDANLAAAGLMTALGRIDALSV